tara:strand:+ start:4851 stop:6266 length:1416 start_codon:yes stop_codon:yes gene_type:complete
MKHINSVKFDTSPISKTKTIKRLTISGDKDAVFSVYVVRNNDSYYYNFGTKTFQSTPTRLLQKKIIKDDGNYVVNILFPTVTADKNYDVYVYAESHFDTDFSRDFNDSLLYRVKNADNRLNEDGTYYLNSDTKLPASLYQYADIYVRFLLAHDNAVVQKNIENPKLLTSANLTVASTGGAYAAWEFAKPRARRYDEVTNKLGVVDDPENKVKVHFLPAMGTALNSMQLARAPRLQDFYVTGQVTIRTNEDGSSNSASTIHKLTSVANIKVGDELLSISGGAALVGNIVLKVDQETKTIQTSSNPTLAVGDVINFKSYGLSGVQRIYGWRLKITNLTGALSTVDHPDTGQPTEFNFVTTKTNSNLTTGTTVDVASTKGLGTGDTIFAAGMTTSDGTPDGTPITIASIVDSDTFTISSALANNSTIIESTQMFFKGSALTAPVSYEVEILEVGDTNMLLYLDLTNVLTITDES